MSGMHRAAPASSFRLICSIVGGTERPSRSSIIRLAIER